ncbi:MAG: MBL fold metallo-hydrolase [Acidobacteriota bacterium]|nr:MBL fold metallo-hydrolase [Acidobacteriota bacterium]
MTFIIGKFARVAVWSLAVGVACGAYPFAAQLLAQGSASPATGSAVEAGGVEVLQLRPNLFLIASGGANVVVQVGTDGAIVVDTGTAASAPAVLAAIKRLTAQPIRYVINTNADPDHVGGNEVVVKAGMSLFTLPTFSTSLPTPTGAQVVASQQVLARMSGAVGGGHAFPQGAWPTETFRQKRRYMFFNDEGIDMLHQPAAHSDGDVVVVFRRSDIVVAGDVLDTTRFPVIDVASGGSVQGELDALNRLLELVIPSWVPIGSHDAGTWVVPGHGRVCNQLDVADYRDMVTIIRDRVQDMIARGLTLAQVQAAAPAQGYARRYGSEGGSWTTQMFVEAVYRSLKAAGPQ